MHRALLLCDIIGMIRLYPWKTVIKMTTFYLVRHGEPQWELCEEYGLKGHGRDLVPLTDEGVRQALTLAKDNRLGAVELILSSPYTRALQTAAILSRELGVELRVEFDLREWQPDLSFEFDSLARLKDLTDDYDACGGVCPPGETKLWEPKATVKARMDAVLSRYKGYSSVIVVAHGEIFRTQVNIDEIKHCSIIEVIL